MPSQNSQKIADDILNRFTSRTKVSADLHQQASEYLPGGSTRAATFYPPYAAYMLSGEGAMLQDADGNSYLDFHNNYTSLIHGHAHAPTIAAAQAQLSKGTIRGAPSPILIEHARLIHHRMPTIEQLRYCNSGTEATMFAIRSARAFTGREIIVKIDGGYHGTHDMVEVNVWADPNTETPVERLQSRGVPKSVLAVTKVVPYNDLAAVERVFDQYRGQLAGMIVEPLLNGAGEITAQPGYLQGLRELCNRYDVLLIFDEVVTFRLSQGGMQVRENVPADLTSLGKIIGGGFAVGAFGGRKDIMALFDSSKPNTIAHSGTFNGNDITLAAGIATLQNYEQAEIDHINGLGDRLRRGFNDAFVEMGVKGQALGLGSLVTLHWRQGDIHNAHTAAIGLRDAGNVPGLLHLELLNRGIFVPRRGQFAISTPMTEAHVDRAVAEFASTLEMLKPYMADSVPNLLIKPA